MTPEEFKATYAPAARGESSWGEAVTKAKELSAKKAPPQAAPKPVAPAQQRVAAPPVAPVPPPPPPKPHVGVPPVFESGDLGETTYGGAARALTSRAADAIRDPRAGASPVRSWDDPSRPPDTSIPFNPMDVASSAKAKVMAALRRAKDATPSPDELLETGKSFLGGN